MDERGRASTGASTSEPLRAEDDQLLRRFTAAFVDTTPDDLDARIEALFGDLGRHLGADRALLFRIEPDEEARLVHEWREPGVPSVAHLAPTLQRDAPDHYGRLASNRPTVVEELATVPDLPEPTRALIARAGVRSLMVVPVAGSRREHWTLSFHTTGGTQRWRSSHLTLVQGAGKLIAQAWAHRESERVRVAERTRAAEALAASEERLRTLVEHLPDLVLRVDRSGTVVFRNELAASALADAGHPASDARSGVPATWAVAVEEVLQTGRAISFEAPLRTGGDERAFEHRVVPERDLDGELCTAIVIARDVTDQRVAERALAHRALHDPLTGLPNRELLFSHLDRAVAAIARHGGSIAVLFFDLDRFKLVNDTLGHLVGDELLRNVAGRLVAAVRPEDLVARLGGDEFVVLIEHLHTPDEAVATGQRLLDALSQPLQLAGSTVVVQSSIGIAIADRSGVPSSDLLRMADAALYRAKEHGRGRCELFDERLEADARHRLEVEQGLRRAIAERELVVHYQPEIDLRDGTLVGVEALVRWQHPQRGLLPAEEFIGIAEETGLIVPIGELVLEEACRQVARWNRHLAIPIVARVNLSARQLAMPGLVDTVAAVAERTEVVPGTVCLEITETALARDPHVADGVLRRLKQLGLQLALDDFGTGYSSLSRLKRFPLDMIKIDRSFVHGLPDDVDDVAIVRTIVALADAMVMDVSAEGIEVEGQTDLLLDLGCHRGQGWLFSPALPAEGIEDLLHTART